jgi:hypothetical protein
VARAKFIESEEFGKPIASAIAQFPEIADGVLRAGADVLADEIKRRLQGELLPESRSGELVQHFGITPMQKDDDGNYNVSIGFGGYQQPGTGKFKSTGVPFMLIARTFESGAVRNGKYSTASGKRKKKSASETKGQYWRQPTHFMSNAVKAAKAKALTVMENYAEQKLEELSKK